MKKIESQYPDLFSDAGGTSGSDIALAPTNNIFLINQDNSEKSSPTIIQGGSDNIAMIRGSGTNSFDSLTKYGEMTALMTV